MAYLAEAAYEEPDGFADRLRRVGAVGEIAWFFDERNHAAAYYFGTADVGVVAFRGTELEFFDVVADATAVKLQTIFGGVHAGFMIAALGTWSGPNGAGGAARPGEALRDLLRRRHADAPRRLYVTGHSMGGALATIAYLLAEYDGCYSWGEKAKPIPTDRPFACVARDGGAQLIPVHAVYTFGSPRVGDYVLGQLAALPGVEGSATPLFRFVRGGDAVTNLPPQPPFWHPHVGGDERARLVHLAEGSFFEGGAPTYYPPSIPDHRIRGYVEDLRGLASSR